MTISLHSSKIAASILPSSALKAQESKSFSLASFKAGTQAHEIETKTPRRNTGKNASRNSVMRLIELFDDDEAGKDSKQHEPKSDPQVSEKKFAVTAKEHTKTQTEFLV